MKKQSFKLAVVALLGVITLAGCSGGKSVATMKGGKITEDELYTELKKAPESSQLLTGMIVNKITDAAYGDKVDQKEVDKEFEKVQDQNGGKKPFEDLLKQNNLDVKTYKENIKSNLAFKEMLKAHLKITDADLKETWATYHPSVDAQIMVFDKKEDAEKALKDVNDGKDFTTVAKEVSKDEVSKKDGGKVTFDSTMATKPEGVLLPEQVKQEAYKLEDGKVSGIVESQNMQTGTDSFYIVKMVKNEKKGNDYKKYEKELKKITEETKMADPAFSQEVLGKELEKANVKIEDDQFKKILDPYLPKKEEKSDKKDDKKSDKKDDKKSDKKEETTESTK
ncbi:peptidylprolyl isomerase [Vagococcus hydrophili]|uniref:Foldase protein PrsA n=1 Tax=Vagococcus hydrophili TaxID=2714947 RepID=A0A6G8ATU3_9ENTE|nr:peptidylprolyl isomerase [Vagococcus hydrophili]QIL48389.1 peptidylprolyl isomerase [Vagococcus hydrophili]